MFQIRLAALGGGTHVSASQPFSAGQWTSYVVLVPCRDQPLLLLELLVA